MQRHDRIRGDLDQLSAAIRDRDGDAAEKAIQDIAQKDPDAAARLVDGLTVEGLRNMTGMD